MIISHRHLIWVPIACLFSGLLAACGTNRSYVILVTATPLSPVIHIDGSGDPVIPVTERPPTPAYIPTPDPTRILVVDPAQDQVHIVQAGDTLNTLALRYGVDADSIAAANNIADIDTLSIGQNLLIPTSAQLVGSDFKIIPDSELLFGPSARGLRATTLLSEMDCFLCSYTEVIGGSTLSGPQIIDRVSLEQSLNPRLLIALLEYHSHWISQKTVSEDGILFPMKYRDRPDDVVGLYKQLDWAGKMLNTGYYGWRYRGLSTVLLADGTRVRLDPTINASTAAVELLLSQTRTYDEWLSASQSAGVATTDRALFGDPFQYAIEPVIPTGLTQPPLSLPWSSGESWYFTGGPHGGWGSGSGWAALDFVPPTATESCDPAQNYAVAVADGVIARSERGIVLLDLDGDGFEGTGWVIVYLHMASEGRAVQVGQRVHQGDPIGYPSCEGGVSDSSHLHIARRYNGEWIPADCSACAAIVPAPVMVLGDWVVTSFDHEYDGSMTFGEEYREACTCKAPLNTITAP
jgi:murein DD-endopeptidase MepM/ murein hydrolase activator NlpD